MSKYFNLERFDKNLAFIWHKLMNAKCQQLATHALFRVLLGSALLMMTPYAIGFYIDGLTNELLDALLVGGVLFISLEISGITLGWWRQQIRERFFQEAFWYKPQAISRLYFSRPLAWLSGGTSEIDGGGVESLKEKVWNVTGSYIFQIIPGWGYVVFGLIACTYANVWLGLLVLLYIVLERVIGIRQNNYISTEMKPVINLFKRWERRMQDWWKNIDHVKSQGAETKILNQIKGEVQEALRGDDAVWRVYFARAFAWHRARSLVSAIGLYSLLGYLVFTDAVTLAVAVLVFFSFERIRATIGDLNDQQREVGFNMASIAKYRRVLSQPVPFMYDEGTDFADQQISVTFDNVSHNVTSREGEKEILCNVSLSIPTGLKIGIIGPSGAGKSQLLSLLVRATDPIGGRVLINNQDLKELKLESLLRYYGVIMQKSEPYEDTVLGNLLFGVSHLDLPTAYEDLPADKQVEICALAHIALEKAGLDPEQFDDGIHTNIGYKGLTLSGGQQQRLQIAAAHLKLSMTSERPRIILADEPTASLDSLSELTVMQHLQENVPNGTTVLMVAHRLSTVANMDKIVFVRPLTSCDDDTTQVTMHDSLVELYETEALFKEMADAQQFVPKGIVSAV